VCARERERERESVCVFTAGWGREARERGETSRTTLSHTNWFRV
jgi:hypothetical protein